MDLVYAAGLFAACTIGFVLLGLAIRGSMGPRLFHNDAFQSLATALASGGWFFALALTLRGLIGTPLHAQFGELMAAVLILAAMAAGLWLLHPLRRLRAYDQASAAAPVVPFPGKPAPGSASPASKRRAA